MNQENSRVYWITGLSGSGKSTLSRNLAAELRGRGRTVILLDGDDLRKVMGVLKKHDRNSRIGLASRYGALCKMLAEQGVDVVIGTISLFHQVHKWNRENIPGYTEIYLDVPLEEVQRRDPKKLYERAARGEVKHVAGMDLKVEPPLNPDVRLVFDPNMKPADVLQELLNQLELANITE